MTWKVYPFYPDYEVSDEGQVRRAKDGKILKQYPQKSGYVAVFINTGRGNKPTMVHTIVAETFLERLPHQDRVDHINTIRSDNRVANLRWADAKENANNETTRINMSKARRKKLERLQIEASKTFVQDFNGDMMRTTPQTNITLQTNKNTTIMKQIEVSKEDYDFLKELQTELNTQETDGNAEPVFWGVMETREIGVPDGCGDPRIYTCDDGKGVVTIDEAVAMIDEAVADEPLRTRLDWGRTYKGRMQDVVSFANKYLRRTAWRIVYVAKEDKLAENTGVFLTKSACQKYIEANKHNLTNPRTYAMTALRNRKYERLVNILRTIKLD